MPSKFKKGGLVGSASIYLVSNILNALIPFALLPILTRYLTPAEYGEVAMFLVWVSLLNAVVGLSLNGAAVRKYYDADLSHENLRAFIASCLQILCITTLASFAIVFIFQARLAQLLGLRPEWVLSGVLLSACTMIGLIRLGQWQASKQAIRYGSFQVSQSALNLGLSLLFVVVLLQGAKGRIDAQVYAFAIFALLALLFLKRDNLLGFFTWRPDCIKEALKFGIPLIPHVAGGYLLLTADRFVINHQLGLKEVGIYMVAVQIGSGINLIFDAVNKAFVPWLYELLKRDNFKEKQKLVKLTYAWYGLILCGVALAFLIGPWLVTLIAGKQYALAGQLFGWIALGQGFRGMYLMQTNYIFYSKQTGILSSITFSSGIFNIVLMLVLIPKFGLLGAAYSFSLAMALFFVLTWLAANKKHPMPWLSFFTARIE